MNYLIIRLYPKDDYIGRLCIESWLKAGYEGEIILYREPGKYKWTENIGTVIERGEVANFGGQLGANMMRSIFKLLNVNDKDVVISCDTDLIISENPLKYFDCDLMGKGGYNDMFKFVHISGQCMIFSGRLINEIKKETDLEFQIRWHEMDKLSISINDDTYFSYFAHINKFNVKTIKYKWIHDKLHHLEPSFDLNKILNDYRKGGYI